METTQIAGSVRQHGWYHGWNIVAVCVLSQVAANGLTYNAYSLFLRDWAAQLHVAISAATAAWQVVALYALLAPLALCLSTAVTANALISRWFVRRLGLALGLSAFGIGMAGVLLPPVIAATLPTVGWRMIWRAGALVVALLVLPLVVSVARNRPAGDEGKYYLSGDSKPAGHHGHAATGSQVGWREVAARKNFWLLVAIYLPMMALYGGVGQNLGPYGASHGLSPQSAGALLSV